MRRAAQEYLHEMATTAVVLRGEERVSLRAAVLFLFLAHLCSIPYTPLFFIYRAPFDILPVVSSVIDWRILFFFLLLLAFSEKKWLLYLLLGPLSFDKVCLIFDQGAQALINKA